MTIPHSFTHEHVFLARDHDRNTRRTLWVVVLTAIMMVAEIVAGGIYGSIAKVDGLPVQLQIADKVRIEVAKTAIVGYQGQESLAESTK